MGPKRGRLFACFALSLIVAFPLMASAAGGPAPATPSGPSTVRCGPQILPAVAGAPTLNGYYIVGHGAALVAVGYISWVDTWVQAPNGTSVYSPTFDLYFFNLRASNVSVALAAEVSGQFVQNATVFVPLLNEASYSLTLPLNPLWSSTVLWFDGVPYWFGLSTTPVVFFGSNLNIVGFADLFSLAIISFMVVVASSGLALARWAMRRAVWAPKMSMLAWGHLPIGILLGAVLIDYQGVTATFGGLSPLVYPFVLIPLFFVTGLWTYRRGERILLLSGRNTERDELGYEASELRLGPLASGYLVWVDPSWSGFWARFWGAYTYVEDPDPSKPRPWLAPVKWVPSPTMSARERNRARRQAASPKTYAEMLTRFPILNDAKKTDRFGYIAWAKTDTLPEIKWPNLRWSHVVHKDAKLQANPSGGPPIVLKPARDVRRPWFPHYEGAGRQAAVELDDIHTAPAHAVWARFASIKDLGNLLAKYKGATIAFAEGLENRVQAEVESELRTHNLLRRRVGQPVSQAEAEDAARAAARLVKGPDAAAKGATP